MSHKTEKAVRSLLKNTRKLNKDKFDKVVRSRLDELDLPGRALKKIGDVQIESVTPIVFGGYEFGGEHKCYIALNKQGEARSSNHNTTIFIFGRFQLFVYDYFLSLVSHYRREEFYEIYYKDICGFAVQNKYNDFTDAAEKKFFLPDRTASILTGGGKIDFKINSSENDTESKLADLKAIIQAKIFKS